MGADNVSGGDFGLRLRDVVDRAGGQRHLAQVLSDRGVRGSSRTMLQQYLSGDVMPPVDWLVAVADIAGVRPAWLAFGEEPIFPPGRGVHFDTWSWTALERGVSKGAREMLGRLYPDFGRAVDVPPALNYVVAHAVAERWSERQPSEEEIEINAHGMAAHAVDSLLGGLSRWGLAPRDPSEADRLLASLLAPMARRAEENDGQPLRARWQADHPRRVVPAGTKGDDAEGGGDAARSS